jgi:hypothetical protein
MSDKIEFLQLVRDHIGTLVDDDREKPSISDYVFFLGIPVGLAGLSAYIGIVLAGDAASLIVSALSILAGLLINVLVLLYTVQLVGPTETEKKEQQELIAQVNKNLLFEILISGLAIGSICLIPFASEPLNLIVSTFSVFLMGVFVLTLLMIMKRLKVLLNLRFKKVAP